MGYATVNGLNLYYETHGSGRPLVLLHGGLGSTEMFEPRIDALVSGGHQVIAPDFQGHGRTADIDRPIDVKLLATDIIALIEQLGLEQPDLVGYSLGGYPPEDDSYRPKALDYALFMDHVDRAMAQTIIERLEASDAPLKAVQLRALGGAMARVPVDATAFAHRAAPILAVAVNFWNDDDDYPVRAEWIRQTAVALDQGVPGAYVGFLREEGEDRLHAAYPDATWERLRDIKTIYDPNNVFERNQNIPPR